MAVHQRYGHQDFEGECRARDSKECARFSQLHPLCRSLSWSSGTLEHVLSLFYIHLCFFFHKLVYMLFECIFSVKIFKPLQFLFSFVSAVNYLVALPVLYFYWPLYPVAAIVLSGGFIVSILLPIVLFSNHRPCLEWYGVTLSRIYFYSNVKQRIVSIEKIDLLPKIKFIKIAKFSIACIPGHKC